MGDNAYVAYCFDEAVIEFGTRLESELEKATQGTKTVAEGERKQRAVFATWLGGAGTKTVGQFAEPAATKKRS